MWRGKLALASPGILTEASVFIKDSGHSQSIFWNYIIRSNIRPHSNVYSSRIYEAGAGESGGVQ